MAWAAHYAIGIFYQEGVSCVKMAPEICFSSSLCLGMEEETWKLLHAWTFIFRMARQFCVFYGNSGLELHRGHDLCCPGQNFIELLSTKICLAWNFFLDKNRITNQISTCWYCWILQTAVDYYILQNHVEIWLVILFLSRKKFHAKQIFVLSSSMKLGPGLCFGVPSNFSHRL